MNKSTQIIIAIFLVIAASIGMAFLARDAGASDPAGAGSIEWRVSHLEGDVRGAYANTSYLTQHIIALEARVGQLERDEERHEELIEHNTDRSLALVTCVRSGRRYSGPNGVMVHRRMVQCIDKWFDELAHGDH